MAQRTIAVEGERWEVFPSGRVTVYGRDEFGLVFQQGTGPERRRRFTRRSRRGPRPRPRTARVDLHCHSTASDGEFPPAEVARRAHAAGLAAFALTDHDTTAGIAEATSSGELVGIRVVPGCEFSVRAPWGELHVLGYFLPPGHGPFETLLATTRAARQRRAEQIVARLRRLGVALALAGVMAVAHGGARRRPHLARGPRGPGVTLGLHAAVRLH